MRGSKNYLWHDMPLILTQILSKKHIWYDMSSLQCSKHIWYWIITAHPNIFRFSRQWFQFHPSLLPGLVFCLHNDYYDSSASEISTPIKVKVMPRKVKVPSSQDSCFVFTMIIMIGLANEISTLAHLVELPEQQQQQQQQYVLSSQWLSC